jgi:hypothetical protein
MKDSETKKMQEEYVDIPLSDDYLEKANGGAGIFDDDPLGLNDIFSNPVSKNYKGGFSGVKNLIKK